MKKILLEVVICLLAASLLMIIHELFKAVVYMIVRGRKNSKIEKRNIWKVFRYIDPLGLVLSVTCYVPVSKPYMFRIRDRKANFIVGISGFIILIVVFFASIWMTGWIYGDAESMYSSLNSGVFGMCGVMFFQYMQMLCFDYFVVNLFPVSTFDMGLVIAGVSPENYFGIIKADTAIKLILILTLMLDLINKGYFKLIEYLPF